MNEQEPNGIKLAVLEEKVFNMVEVISKLDDTIEKLSDLSLNVSKMLAVHEEKLDFARDSAAETAKDIYALEKRLNVKINEGDSRLDLLERKVWMGIGGITLFFVTLMVVTPVLTEAAFLQEIPAIMEDQSRP